LIDIQKNLITVGIPFYSKTNPAHLREAIDSILTQSLLPSKIHLIQDGPIPKEIETLIKKYQKEVPDLFLLLSLEKKGLPHALNKSISKCKTKYYARMDSDDIAFKERLEKQVAYLEKETDIDILGGWSVEFKGNNNKEDGFINKRPNDSKRINEYFHYMNPLIHPTVIFRVEVFEKIGLYNERFYSDQDLELWGRALKNKIKISNLQESLLYFRIDGRQKRRSKFSAIRRQIIARYSYNTLSIRLNVLKLSSIFFRLLPKRIRLWSYKNIR
tara:strand:- start:484 stop:1299 length:816 start_codon:yes stop_codon:yes gene_type:complete